MKIVIVEGIATSGKTSIINELEKLFINNAVDYSILKEELVLIPLLKNTNPQIALRHLTQLLQCVRSTEILIIERFHFTHILRTHSNIRDFSELEKMIVEYCSMICLLYIPTTSIPQSINNALEYRSKQWVKYVWIGRNSLEEIYEYYQTQQDQLELLATQTSIPTYRFNVLEKDFEKIAHEIFLLLFK